MFKTKNLHSNADEDQRPASESIKNTLDLAFTQYLNELREYEISQRLRRVEYHLHEVAYKAIPHREESGKDKAKRIYNNTCVKTQNISMFYKLATVIRKNYQEWRKYIADPTMSVSTSFKPVTDNKALAFCFAVLESLGVVNLDIRKPFFIGTPVRGKIFLEAELTMKRADDTLLLWNSLGRPKISSQDPSFMERCERFIFSSPLRFLAPKCTSSTVGSFFIEIHSLMRDEYFVPINTLSQEANGSTVIGRYEIDFWKLIDDASLSMAYDSCDSNTLQSISELFPEYPEFIAESIGAYYWFSIAPPSRPPYRERGMAFLALREALYEHFLGDKKHLYIKSDCGEGAIHHNIALEHLYKFPRLRKDFKKSPNVLSLLQRDKYDRNPEGL